MALDKNSLRADAVANFYRAALYLAKGNLEVGLDFLKKAEVFFPDETTGFEEIIKNPEVLKGEKERLFWAEKILDQYQKYRLLLS